jgi:hypothetical protein
MRDFCGKALMKWSALDLLWGEGSMNKEGKSGNEVSYLVNEKNSRYPTWPEGVWKVPLGFVDEAARKR